MGAQMAKGGVAAEGKAAAEPAAAKANGQVSGGVPVVVSSSSSGSGSEQRGGHMAPNAHCQRGCHGGAQRSHPPPLNLSLCRCLCGCIALWPYSIEFPYVRKEKKCF